MSSSEETGLSDLKNRRPGSSYDQRRRKKRRCDGRPHDHIFPSKDLFTCTCNELSEGRPNTEWARHGTSLADKSLEFSTTERHYVEALKMRLQIAEARLERQKQNATDDGLGLPLVLDAIRGLAGTIVPPHPDDLAFADIEASMKALSVHGKGGFYGNSSSAMLIKSAVEITNGRRRLPPQDTPPCGAIPGTIQSWKGHTSPPMSTYSFPETDLLDSLVSLYFANVNAFLPVLHRPVFDRDLRQHFHRTHSGFATTVLLVCALGALYSTDPRVSSPGTSGEDTAGRTWFDQVNPCGHLLQVYATGYDIQNYCLAAEFLDATANPRMCWNAVGFGMRAAQDMGIHRSNVDSAPATFLPELERRALWVLLLFDTHVGTALGRTSTLDSPELDLDMPAVCDDAFWGTLDTPPSMRFRQPADTPSVVAFFNCMIQVNRILARSCEILYSSDRKRLEIGLDAGVWQERAVAELDAMLNAWFQAIPEHLRWDPDARPIQDDTFFDQAAALQCAYYHTRITIHRPFIPLLVRGQEPTHASSLAICNTAARACAHVAEMQHRRRPDNPLWFSKNGLFSAGIVLLMNVWGGPGNSRAKSKDRVDVERIVAVLSSQRRQWPSVGPLLETLQQLMAVDPAVSVPHSAQDKGSIPAVSSKPVPQRDLDEGTVPHAQPHECAPLLAIPSFDPQLETAPADYLDGYLARRAAGDQGLSANGASILAQDADPDAPRSTLDLFAST
ncbi:fungal-specific transcription factor domain-containing protein [Mycena latifolia]|nr:fungal-specific transcription factor domain-containing protein [Mycena latifolia]